MSSTMVAEQVSPLEWLEIKIDLDPEKRERFRAMVREEIDALAGDEGDR